MYKVWVWVIFGIIRGKEKKALKSWKNIGLYQPRDNHESLVMYDCRSTHVHPEGGGVGVLGKSFGREAQHMLEKWTQSDLTGFKKRGQLDWKLGKRGSIGLNINRSLAIWAIWGCWKGHPIGLKISKKRIITTEPPYHAHLWEYSPPPSPPDVLLQIGLR